MTRRSGIYTITQSNNGKVYVGSSSHIASRWSLHRSTLRRGNHDNSYLQAAWNKYGEEAFAFTIIEIVPDTDKLLEREQHFINALRAYDRQTGFNLKPIAGSNRGFRHTEVTKQRIGMGHLGKKHTPMSQEARERLSITRKGKPKSKEHAKKISVALKGRRPSLATIQASIKYHTGTRQSPELRAKRSKATKGRPLPELASKKVRAAIAKRRLFDEDTMLKIIKDRQLGLSYDELAEKYQCSDYPIRRIISGDYKAALKVA